MPPSTRYFREACETTHLEEWPREVRPIAQSFICMYEPIWTRLSSKPLDSLVTLTEIPNNPVIVHQSTSSPGPTVPHDSLLENLSLERATRLTIAIIAVANTLQSPSIYFTTIYILVLPGSWTMLLYLNPCSRTTPPGQPTGSCISSKPKRAPSLAR